MEDRLRNTEETDEADESFLTKQKRHNATDFIGGFLQKRALEATESPERGVQEPEAPMALPRPEVEASPTAAPEIHQHDHRHEAGAALGAFVGAEILDVHRNRKTKREMHRELRRVAEVAKQTRTQREQLALQQEHQTRHHEKLKELVRSSRSLDAKPPAESILPPGFRPESRSIQPLPREQFRESLPDVPERQPEKVLKEVEIAAEMNIPIESLYERRHETKDKESDPMLPTSSLGTVMPTTSVSRPLPTRSDSLQDTANSPLPPSISVDHQLPAHTARYSTATKVGVGTALVILTVLFLILLLR